MMRLSFFLLLVFLYIDACKVSKNDMLKEDLPSCIQMIINSPEGSSRLLTIKAQSIKGTQHYWLNTGDNTFDGAEYIVGKNCDTLCVYGSRPPDTCNQFYPYENWKIIWKK